MLLSFFAGLSAFADSLVRFSELKTRKHGILTGIAGRCRFETWKNRQRTCFCQHSIIGLGCFTSVFSCSPMTCSIAPSDVERTKS